MVVRREDARAAVDPAPKVGSVKAGKAVSRTSGLGFESGSSLN